MTMLHCPEGDHQVKVGFKPTAGERFCPEHGCPLRPLPKTSFAGTLASWECRTPTT